MDSPVSLTTPDEIAELISTKLLAVVTRAAKSRLPEKGFQTLFVYSHARNIAGLFYNLIRCKTHLQSFAAGVMVRPMLESYLSFRASLYDPNFAGSKVAAEHREELRRHDMIVSLPYYQPTKATFDLIRDDIQKAADAHIKDNNVTNLCDWGAFNVAQHVKNDDLVELFRVYYHYSSTAVHGAYSEVKPTEKLLSRGFRLQVATAMASDTWQLYEDYVEPEMIAERDNPSGLRKTATGTMKRLLNEKAYQSLRYEGEKA
jgi:hypothetical protein